MHKAALNRARLDLRLIPAGPLCVKSGDQAIGLLRPELPDLMCVRTRRNGRHTVYVPGASLKGVVRSSAERVLRSLGLACCDPLSHTGPCQRDASRLGDEVARRGGEGPHPMAGVYRMVCLACRTFGSQALASRVSFADAYPPEDEPELFERANQTESRSGVSIDRRTGGPARGKLFEQETVTGGAFDTTIHLGNFELWQLGLVGLVLRELDDGFVRLGSAKSRGFGQVRVELRSLRIDQLPGGRSGIETLAGVGALASDWRDAYGLLEDQPMAGGPTPRPGALGLRFDWMGQQSVGDLLDALLDAPWSALVERGPRA